MGNHGNKPANVSQDFYCLKQTEVRTMSEIWKSVETNLAHYETQFYSILFHNHPEYLKYFHEDEPHEFQVRDVPTMRTKFSLTCSTLAALFVECYNKSEPRENLLGYVAMVHKDMSLTQKDMENFMMDMMEMLSKNYPNLMTADCCLAYIRYTASLTSRVEILMKNQREISRINSESSRMSKKDLMAGCFRSPYCAWVPCRNEDLVYGRPPEYWEKRSRHWIVQRAVWATTGGENRADSFNKDIISRASTVKISKMSISKDSTSSQSEPKISCISETITKRVCAQSGDSIHDENTGERGTEKQTVRRKRHFRKWNNPSTLSIDDVSDADAENNLKSSELPRGYRKPMKQHQAKEALKTAETPKTTTSGQLPNDNSDSRPNEVRRGRTTARERRRRKNSNDDHSLQRLVSRRLTIENWIGIGKYTDEPSVDGAAGERDIRSSLPESRNVANKTKDRGTSISNTPNQSTTAGKSIKPMEASERSSADAEPPASVIAKTDPPSSIIGSSSVTGRNPKTAKRVSISNAHWIAPREFNKYK